MSKYANTPAGAARQAGFSLAEVSRLSGVSVHTLANWHANKPRLFRLVLFGLSCEQKIAQLYETMREHGK